jgi:hypothetical protein
MGGEGAALKEAHVERAASVPGREAVHVGEDVRGEYIGVGRGPFTARAPGRAGENGRRRPFV